MSLLQNQINIYVNANGELVPGSAPTNFLYRNNLNRNVFFIVTPLSEAAVVKLIFKNTSLAKQGYTDVALPTQQKGSNITNETASYYNIVKDWNVFKCIPNETILAKFPSTVTGTIALTVSIKEPDLSDTTLYTFVKDIYTNDTASIEALTNLQYVRCASAQVITAYGTMYVGDKLVNKNGTKIIIHAIWSSSTTEPLEFVGNPALEDNDYEDVVVGDTSLLDSIISTLANQSQSVTQLQSYLSEILTGNYLSLDGGTLSKGGFKVGSDEWGNEFVSIPVDRKVFTNDTTGENLIKLNRDGKLEIHWVEDPLIDTDVANKKYADKIYNDSRNYTDANVEPLSAQISGLNGNLEVLATYIPGDTSASNKLVNETELNSKIVNVYKYKGSVATYNDLPTTNLTNGDVYNVLDTGKNYAYVSSTNSWDDLGGSVDLSNYYTKNETEDKITSNIGKLPQLDFTGTLVGTNIVFEPTTPINASDLTDNITYELDFHFAGVGLLNSYTMSIKLSDDTIVWLSSILGSGSVGAFKQLEKFDVNTGYRWVVNAVYNTLNGVHSFGIPSTIVKPEIISVSDEDLVNAIGTNDYVEGQLLFVSSVGNGNGYNLGFTYKVVYTMGVIDNYESITTEPMISITHADLLAKVNAGTLIAGQQYRITDYTCSTSTIDTQSAGHQFDIIVKADSSSVLNENARAILHDGDTYFANAKLSAWKLKYSITNDTSRFAWADEANGKGVIYQMVDEFNNDCPYDFKNIQFKRKLTNGVLDLIGGVDTWVYTFTLTDLTNSDIVDISLKQNTEYPDDEQQYRECANNSIKEAILDYEPDGLIRLKLNDNVFLNVFDNNDTYSYYGCYSNTFGNSCSSNTFGTSCSYNTFGNSCYSNAFGTECYNNTFGASCSGNTFGASCSSNTFGTGCFNNTFGDSCSGNTFGIKCNNNTFGASCSSNTFGANCYYNTFGTGCNKNTFGTSCFSNTFGTRCSSNAFGTGCSNNTFGTYCSNNTFGTKCFSNTFGTGCSSNTFGTTCYSNAFGASCYNNTFGTGCNNNTFGIECNNNTFGNSCQYDKITGNSVRYLNIDNGIQGTSAANKLELYDSGAIANKEYQISFKKSASGRYLMLWATDTGTMTGKYKALNTDAIWTAL